MMRELALTRESVRLASGRRSDYYLDARQVLLDPEGAALAGRIGFELLRGDAPRAVGGLTLGADPLVSAISLAAWAEGEHWTGFLVRKEAKSHGLQQWLEGPFIEEGTPVAVVDDVLTSGGSLATAIERARQGGGVVTGALVVVDRQEDGGRERVEEILDGAPLRAVFTAAEILGDAGE
jgi:orotate phosphoribosyltransferase